MIENNLTIPAMFAEQEIIETWKQKKEQKNRRTKKIKVAISNISNIFSNNYLIKIGQKYCYKKLKINQQQ